MRVGGRGHNGVANKKAPQPRGQGEGDYLPVVVVVVKAKPLFIGHFGLNFCHSVLLLLEDVQLPTKLVKDEDEK